MGPWDGTLVRERFEKRADELARRLPSVRIRASEKHSFQVMHDEMLAKLSVYRVLLDSASLDTRDGLLSALTKLSVSPPLSGDAIDPATFAAHCREFVAGLAGQYNTATA
jgi:hypothetical protein